MTTPMVQRHLDQQLQLEADVEKEKVREKERERDRERDRERVREGDREGDRERERLLLPQLLKRRPGGGRRDRGLRSRFFPKALDSL